MKNFKIDHFVFLLIFSFFPWVLKSQVPSKEVNRIVLVHGAFADGTSWSKVAGKLQRKGYQVIAVQNPLTSLEDDVAATHRAIESMDGPVLLVGHSWGGMVISQAGNHPKVSGLVYVSALIPDEGQSVVDVLKPFPQAPGSAEFQLDNSGFLHLSRKGIHEDFAQDLGKSQQELLYATQVHWAAKATTQAVSPVAWRSKPSWSIVALNDRMINPDLEGVTAEMIGATVLEINSGHIPMVSHPGKVTDFILSALKELSVE